MAKDLGPEFCVAPDGVCRRAHAEHRRRTRRGACRDAVNSPARACRRGQRSTARCQRPGCRINANAHEATQPARSTARLYRSHPRSQAGRGPAFRLDPRRQDLAGGSRSDAGHTTLPGHVPVWRPGRTRLLSGPDAAPAHRAAAPRGQHRAAGGPQRTRPRAGRHATGPGSQRKLLQQPAGRGPTGSRPAHHQQGAAGRRQSAAGG